MQETVRINGISLCHKNSDGFVRSTLPDICKSPSAPAPYTNTAFAKDLADGTVTVFSHKGAMNGIRGSRFAVSIGDEPGVGGGVVSGVNKGEATWLSWSSNVFMEGSPVTRLTDKMLMNKGNMMSAGGYYTGNVNDPANKELLEQICKAACECLAEGTMSEACVDKKVTDWAAKQSPPRKVISEAAYKRVVDALGKATWILNQRSNGTILRGGGSRPDFTDIDNDSLIEVKLPNDRFRGDQNERYSQIADDNDLTREDVFFKDCDCDGKGRKVEERKAEEAAEKEAKKQSSPSMAFWGVVGASVLGVGAVACIIVEPCGAVVAGGVAAASEFLLPAAAVGAGAIQAQ